MACLPSSGRYATKKEGQATKREFVRRPKRELSGDQEGMSSDQEGARKIMSESLAELLAQLPGDKKLNQDTCDFLNKEIRRGVDLNLLQREELVGLVQFCLDKGHALPTPFESFWAAVYLEWGEEAKTSDDVKRKLTKLVQTLKANPALASTVSQTVQAIQKERAARREAMAKLAAAMLESAARNPLQVSK